MTHDICGVFLLYDQVVDSRDGYGNSTMKAYADLG